MCVLFLFTFVQAHFIVVEILIKECDSQYGVTKRLRLAIVIFSPMTNTFPPEAFIKKAVLESVHRNLYDSTFLV
jgi:hypothetical protein